jgi:hypothetical protein
VAAAAPIPVTAVRSRLAGETPSQVAECMGQPPIQRTRGSITLWSYPATSPAADNTVVPLTDPGAADFVYAPLSGDELPNNGLGMTEGPVAPSSCMVNVVFDSGKVQTVTYVDPNGRLMRSGEACTSLVSACTH